MITTLLLDVDGVLVSSAPEFTVAMDREYAWRDGVGAFLHDLGDHPREAASLVDGGDLLSITEELLPAHVIGLDAAEFLDRLFAEDIVVNLDLIRLLGRTTIKQVYLATNQDRRRGSYIHELFAAQPWHTGSLMSYDLGFAKPDPAYFHAALKRIGADPDECLFVDDRLANVETAAALGIATSHYRDLPQFSADLQALGLLS